MAATVDTDEIDKNFDGSSMQDRPANGEPTGKGAYEPPLPVPPVSAHTGVHPSDIGVTLESGTGASPVAYGTFKSPDNSSESPLVNRTSPRSNSVDADFKEGDDHPLSPAVILTSHLLPVTTIDADID